MGRIAKNDGKGDLVVSASVATNTFLALPDDEQEDLRVMAMPVFTLLYRGDYKGAQDMLDSFGMDDTYYVAIWHLFDSSQRRLMKEAARK